MVAGVTIDINCFGEFPCADSRFCAKFHAFKSPELWSNQEESFVAKGGSFLEAILFKFYSLY